MITKTILSCLALVAFASGHAFGSLRFEQPTIELTGDGAEEEFPAMFRFVNEGTGAVRIIAVRPACGCTTTELAKDVYSPGETGELRAVLRAAGLNGVIAKDIVLETDEFANNRYTVTIRARRHELVTVTPRLLYWIVDEKPAAKAIVVKYANANAVRLIESRSPAEAFHVVKKETNDPPGIILHVAPAATTEELQTELMLAFQTDTGRTIEHKVFLRVFPKPAGVAPLLNPGARP